MAIQVKRRWDPDFASDLPRRDRKGCEYTAYVPDRLVGRNFVLRGDVAADVAEAEAAIQRLNNEAGVLVNSEAMARLLLRAEAVASSRIEGLEVGGRRLLRAEAGRGLGVPVTDVTAEEVLGNIAAMTWAVDSVSPADVITTEHILEVHRRLLAGTRLQGDAGVIRTEQNWIGGSSYNPCGAEFVPPPREEVPALLEDLCAFCSIDSLPPVVQAAIAHAQFETIHPFVDGNGRTGRALIHVVLRRRGVAPRVLPPVSLILATWSRGYINALTGTRYVGDADSQLAVDGANAWIALFASACKRAVDDARLYEDAVGKIKERWRRKLGTVRRGSSVDLLLEALPGSPIVTVGGAADLIGRSFQAVNGTVGALTSAGVLRPVSLARRNRAFEAYDVIDAFNDLERRLASPAGNTRTSRPRRRVPYRAARSGG